MKWVTIIKPGTTKCKVKFAWLPVRTIDNYTVWLEKYRQCYVWHSKWVKTNKWVKLT